MTRNPGFVPFLASLIAAAFFLVPAFAYADTVGPINFESPYTTGNINGQQGWTSTGAYDQGVVSSPVISGSQSFRISNAVTTGSFGDQTFSPPLTDSAGETGSDPSGFPQGTLQTHFESQFTIEAIPESIGDIMSVSPDTGNGGRMSYLRFDNESDGIHVYFDDVTAATACTPSECIPFNETEITPPLDASVSHTIKFSMDFVDGPSNDVVKIYIDGNLVHTGTSWENYYRFDPESNPSQDPNFTHSVRSMLFREGGTAVPANEGKGFLIDDLSLLSSTPIAECNPNASQTIVSDTSTQDTTDSHAAVALSFIHPAWTASIPGAIWIWSDNPVVDTTVETVKTFTRTFNIVGTPLGATLAIAADNYYSVSINGHDIDAGAGHATDNNFTTAANYTIPAGDLLSGSNTLTIVGDNEATPSDSNPADNPAGILYSLTVNNNECVVPPPPTSTVTIDKFVDGVAATTTAATASFSMQSSWNATNIGAGSGTYALNTGDSYDAVTAPMTSGATYTTNEVADGVTVGDCSAGAAYSLAGYSTGATLAAAIAAGPSATVPNFSDLTSNENVIVWNATCTPVQTLKVHILKYLDGAEATAVSANNYLFPMQSSWTAANIGSGSGFYQLGNNFGGAADLYGADTAAMSAPATYATNEVTNDLDNTSKVLPVGATCVAGDYRLDGYQTSPVSFADATTQTLSPTSPSFSGVSVDQYVIVDNETCPTTGSLTIEKDTIGGNGTFAFTSDIPGGATFNITTTGTAAGGTGDSQTFSNLTPGTYHVTETAQTGWTQTDNECSAVVVAAGDPVVCTVTNTKNPKLGEIRGTKYEDLDGDGKLTDGDHHRLAGVTIYLDTNNNGHLDSGEPTSVTDSHGDYDFAGLAAGTYHVREVVPTGWIETVPSSGVYNVTLAAGQIVKKDNFGDFKLGSISGMKFNDLNGNGRKDKNEPGLAGVTINLKGPHGFSASTVTAADGSYSFTNLGPGVYTLSEVVPVATPAWHQTLHPSSVWIRSGTNAKNDNFGNTQLTKDKDGDYDGDNDSHGNH